MDGKQGPVAWAPQWSPVLLVASALSHPRAHAGVQDNTLADRPMVELLTMLMHMLDLARANAAAHGAAQQLNQLVLVLADGRFHEKDALRRMVMVRATPLKTGPEPSDWGHGFFSMQREEFLLVQKVPS